MTTSTVFVLASDGSFGVSLLFFGPVALLLLALGALTLRDRRRAREDPSSASTRRRLFEAW